MGFTGNRAEGPLIEEVNTVPEKLGESPVGPSQTFSLWLVSGLEQDLEISTEALLPLLAWVGSSTQYSQLKAKTPPPPAPSSLPTFTAIMNWSRQQRGGVLRQRF